MDRPGKIKIMPKELASRIAAGEVVERPASVIKELVENALDAGASSIEVEVSLQRRRMRVKDDGCGIASGEIEFALARHGTNKVYTTDDIFGIGTLGFRGEALPSIASVSRLTLSSHCAGEKEGRRIIVEGGKTLSVTDAPAINGTEVLAENLFFNTPARRKFTRSDSTEMTHITSSVIQAALSFPSIRFSFTRDKKRVLQLPPAGNLAERVRQIFGGEYADRLIEIDYKDGKIRVTGLAGRPDFNRATSIDQYFFVNSRPVKDVLIRAASARSFDDLIPRGRKPVLFLKLEMPLDFVDVNVHPAKAEVRFSEPGRVSSTIVAAIRKSLGKSATPVLAQERVVFGTGIGQPKSIPSASGCSFSARPADGFKRSFELWSQPLREESREGLLGPASPDFRPTHGRLSKRAVPLGQLFKTFLLIEEDERLLVLDQHTVHERILFERIMNRLEKSSLERQRLLITESISTNAAGAELIRSHLKTFSDLGWVMEDFGETSFVIREVPALLVGKNYKEIVMELAETIAENRDADFKQMISELVGRMACRAAVKAGDNLSLKEIAVMTEELGKTELPYTCPHGRPVALEMTKEELGKNFGRRN